MGEVIESSVGRFWLEDGLLRYLAREGHEQSRPEAEDSMRIFVGLADGKRRAAVLEIVGVAKLSREARAIYSSEEAARTFTAVALVVTGSVVARTLVNFILTVSRTHVPARMFESRDEAIAWARTYTLAV